MPNASERTQTCQERQRASICKDVVGKNVAKQDAPEQRDPNCELPARTLTWFVTEDLRRSRTSINILSYLAGVEPRTHDQLRIEAERLADLAIQITGILQHICAALPGMDWPGSEFTPLPLINSCRTFLASLVRASKFGLDTSFSNHTWAKLGGLEAFEVGKCERALGMSRDWRLWVGRTALRECIVPAPVQRTYLLLVDSVLSMSPPTVSSNACSAGWESPTLSGLRNNVNSTRSNSPISTIFTQGSPPSLALYTDSDPGSESRCVAPALPVNSMLSMSPPTVFSNARSAVWENPTLSGLRNNVGPTRSSSPISTVFAQGSTPSLALYTDSEPGSEADAPQGFGKFSQWTHTPNIVGEPDELLHRSLSGYPSTVAEHSTPIASEPFVDVYSFGVPLPARDLYVWAVLPRLGNVRRLVVQGGAVVRKRGSGCASGLRALPASIRHRE